MKIQVKNFCLIKEADLEIKSISIIGAENDTGKSTIGKILFCMFYSSDVYIIEFLKIFSSDLKEKFDKISLKEENKKMARDYISLDLATFIYSEELKEKTQKNNKKMMLLSDLKEKIYTNVENYLLKGELLNKEIINNFKSKYLSKGKNTFSEIEKSEILTIVNELNYLLTLLDDKKTLLMAYLKKTFQEIFSNKVGNFESDSSKTIIEVEERGYSSKMIFNDNNFNQFNITNINKVKDVIYIETPLFLDTKNLLENIFRKSLREKLENVKVIIETEEIKQLKEEILKLINSIILGKLYYDNVDKKYKFKRSNEDLQMKSVASGIKSFGIISLLLENNHLTKDTILIIDEPEVHLHPKWQIKYAEILCLLAKKIGLKILVNSHSPYFIEAISVYSNSSKYNLKNDTKFYSYDIYSDGNVLVDKTDDLVFIYKKLAEPYDILNKEKYSEVF